MIARIREPLRALRVSRPWTYKAPFLISVPYTLLVLGEPPFGVSLAAILASGVTILGVAGVAYLLNDWADREADAAAGKPNFTLGRSRGQLVLLVGLFLALAVGPWLTVLPLTQVTGGLLALELALFAVYSLPPLRLKERGAAGALCDALYAHVNPALLAATCFAILAQVPNVQLLPLLAVLAVWQLALGLRNILLHQIGDLEADRTAGLQTWVLRLGTERAEWRLRTLAVPAEALFFLAWLLLMAPEIRPLLPGLAACWALTSFWIRVRWQAPWPDLRSFLYAYLDDFYCEWIPLLVLLELGLRDPLHLLLIPLHILLFPKNAVLRVWKEYRPSREA